MNKEKSLTPKLRFPDFSGEWEEKRFPSIVLKSNQGVNTTTEKVVYVEDGYPVVRSNNVLVNKLDLKELKYVDEKTFNRISENCKPKKGDILYCNIGSALGSASLFLRTEPTLINWNVFRIQPNKEILNTYYFTQYLNFKKNYMLRFATQSTMPFISGKAFKKLKTTFPSLPEQEKIAQFLSSVDSKVEKLEKKKELLEEYIKGMMQKIFSQEIRFSDENGNEYPKWEKKKLGEITTLMQSGLSRKLEDRDIGIPVIRSNNLKEGKVSINDTKYWYKIDDKGAKLENYYLKKNDLLVNFINSLAQIGKTSIYNNEFDRNVIFTTNLMRLNFNKNISPKFMFNLFQIKKYKNYIQSITKPAVNQASFTSSDFKRFEFSLPSLPEQEKIANFLSSLDKKIELVTNEINSHKEFKKGLLQQMFV